MNVQNLIKLSDKITAGNLKFAKMSNADQRVAVAKDALAQLLLGNFKATTGTYVGSTKSLDKLKKLPQCNVCAIGSVLVSNFRCGGVDTPGDPDGFTRGRFTYNHNAEELGVVFDNDTLRAMEEYFEQEVWNDIERDYSFDDEISMLENPEHRLFAILSNVIENDGNFVPPSTPTNSYDRRSARERAAETVKAFEKARAKAATFS